MIKTCLLHIIVFGRSALLDFSCVEDPTLSRSETYKTLLFHIIVSQSVSDDQF
jgi:hypothetical protein